MKRPWGEVRTMDMLRLRLRNPAAMVFADPPYNLGKDYGRGASADRLDSTVFHMLLAKWIAQSFRLVRPGGAVMFLVPEAWADETGEMMTQHGPRFNRIIWVERFSQYTERRMTNEHRHLFIHHRPGDTPAWYPDAIRVPSVRMEMGDKRAAGPRVPGDVWVTRRLQGTSRDRVPGHPCQTPPETIGRLIEAFSRLGQTVLDPFCGVGSTGIAAICTGRGFFGCEINEDYARIARERLDAEHRATCGSAT